MTTLDTSFSSFVNHSVFTMGRLSSTPRKAAHDCCRVCQMEFVDKKQKHRLFASDLDRALSSVLKEPVYKGDGLPEALCSQCRCKVLRAQRLEREVGIIRQAIKEQHAKTAEVIHFFCSHVSVNGSFAAPKEEIGNRKSTSPDIYIYNLSSHFQTCQSCTSKTAVPHVTLRPTT